MSTIIITVVITLLISGVVFTYIGYTIRKKTAESKIKSAEIEAKRIIDDGKVEAEKLKEKYKSFLE